MAKRNFIQLLGISARGVAMGAADVIPGVSGGTIAFITGIYEELLKTISSFNLEALKVLKKQGLAAAWKHVNGTFLLALVAGIGLAIAGLTRVVLYLLDHHPVMLWSFFFGLIAASAYMMATTIKRWNTGVIIALALGTAIAYAITVLSPRETPDGLWFIFISGMIAICAMILPGISGSFILLLLGKYQYVLTAVKEVKLSVIITFAAGCIVGLLSFSRVLSWMFEKQKDLTIALLSGFLVGSLNKIWPWKMADRSIVIDGKTKILSEVNLMPFEYSKQTGQPDHLLYSILLCVSGIVFLLVLEKVAVQKEKPVQNEKPAQ
jgi:putative membrane protein